MYAPSDACKALYELHPQLRLGWVGYERRKEDDLNAGSFAVVQLYNVRDAGTPDEPVSFREFWHVMPLLTENGELINRRIDRGPIYNRFGGSTPDWDPLFRVPMFIMTLDQQFVYPDGKPIRIEDVYSGKFILAVKHFLGPITKRIIEGRRARGRELDKRASDLGAEMGAYLWHEANKTGQTGNHTILREERVAAMKAMHEPKWRRNKSFEEEFAPPPVKR